MGNLRQQPNGSASGEQGKGRTLPDSPALQELDALRQQASEALLRVTDGRANPAADAPASRTRPLPDGAVLHEPRSAAPPSPALIELELLSRAAAAALQNIVSPTQPSQSQQ